MSKKQMKDIPFDRNIKFDSEESIESMFMTLYQLTRRAIYDLKISIYFLFVNGPRKGLTAKEIDEILKPCSENFINFRGIIDPILDLLERDEILIYNHQSRKWTLK